MLNDADVWGVAEIYGAHKRDPRNVPGTAAWSWSWLGAEAEAGALGSGAD